jgi:hypothetical protein
VIECVIRARPRFDARPTIENDRMSLHAMKNARSGVAAATEVGSNFNRMPRNFGRDMYRPDPIISVARLSTWPDRGQPLLLAGGSIVEW